MVRFRNLLLAAVATAVFSLENTVNAGVVFDNLNSPTSAGVPPSAPNPDPLSGDGPQYASFSTGDDFSGLTLSDVTLLLSYNSGTPDYFTVSLFSDNGSNSPNSLISALGTFRDSTLSSTPAPYDISGLSINLAANTRYWIQLSGSASNLSWSFAQDDTGIGIASEFSAYYSGGYSTGTFLVTSNTDYSAGGPYQMRVTTIPEPGTFSLGLTAIGIGVLGFARRRTHRSC